MNGREGDFRRTLPGGLRPQGGSFIEVGEDRELVEPRKGVPPSD